MVAIKKIAGIILVVLILFILIFALTGLYDQLFEDGIKKLFGEKTDSEITQEQNTQATKAFEKLEIQIKECQDSKDNNCGCLVDLNKFGGNHKIEFTDKETKLINIKNLEGKGIQMSSFDKKINCYWDEKLKEKDLTIINFGEEPFILKEIKLWPDSEYKFTHNFNLLKINNKLCWLTDQVKENTIKDIKEC